jgi:serine/threonine protein kinase
MEDSNDSEGGGVTPQLLSKRFLLLTEVRPGGMGVVQKAADLKTSQFAAIKRVSAAGDQLRGRTSFSREVEAISRLDHPNIVKFLLVDQDADGQWFLALSSAMSGRRQPD